MNAAQAAAAANQKQYTFDMIAGSWPGKPLPFTLDDCRHWRLSRYAEGRPCSLVDFHAANNWCDRCHGRCIIGIPGVNLKECPRCNGTGKFYPTLGAQLTAQGAGI